MGLSFFVSLFFVAPLPSEVLQGLIPTIPEVAGGKMMVAAFVGTTMASATFLSRPLFVKGKGWNISHLNQQKKDAITAAILVFIISGAVMAVASGALYHQGKPVTQVLDMANTLEPVAGSLAVAIFFFGTLSAGLSSIFPCLLIAPLLLADYQSGELDTTSRQFKIITFIADERSYTVPEINIPNFDCVNDSILVAFINPEIADIKITGTNFSADKKSFFVYQPGTYFYTLVNDKNCETKGQFEVKTNDIVPNINVDFKPNNLA